MIYSYTDHHDVDEDLKTIAGCGGRWLAGITAGVFDRYMDSNDNATYIVASMKKINRTYTPFGDAYIF